jgi:N utilization substance protein B
MHQRRKAREVTLQVLYELDVLGIDIGEAIARFWANFDAPEEARQFSSFLIEGTWNNREKIDSLISGSSENWTMARMSRVDKSILRMAVYERKGLRLRKFGRVHQRHPGCPVRKAAQ